jgi:hypothetical protein
MKSKIIYVPHNIDLEELTRNNPPSFEFDHEYAYLILYGIIKQSYGKFKDVKNWTEFHKYKRVKSYMVRRSSKDLQNDRRDYKMHFDYLYQNNILWRAGYSEKVYRGHQIAPEYFGEQVRFIKIQNPKILRLLKPKDDARDAHYPLNKWFDTKLSIDTESASEGLNLSFNDGRNYYKYIKNCQLIVNLHNGDINFSRKEYSDDRLHSDFTLFPSVLRKHLRYDGQSLGEVDISSSVPFFMYYLFLSIVDINQINQEVYTNFFKKPRFYEPALKKTVGMVKLDSVEVQKFGKDILQGNYYRQFIDMFDDEYFISNSHYELKREFNYSDDDKLKIIKTRMLSWPNARATDFKSEQAVFKKLYPTIYDFLTKFKRRRYIAREGIFKKKAEKIAKESKIDIKETFQQHKKVSHLFLQLESYMMLDIVARKLNKSRTKIPFFTLHDCIITTKDNVEELKQFMEEIFTTVVGLSPNLRLSYFEPSQS